MKESWCDEYFKWIFGCANTQGGKLFIGVDDSKVNGIQFIGFLLKRGMLKTGFII